MATTYQKTNDANIVRRVSDGAFVPLDPKNRDYTDYSTYIVDAVISESDLDSYA